MRPEYPSVRSDRHWQRRAFSLAVFAGVVVAGLVLAVFAVVWEVVKLVVRSLG